MRKTLLALSLLWASASAMAADPLTASEAKIRETPPGAMATAAFMTLSNTGEQAVLISAASSEAFGRIELHLSKLEDGVAKMIPQANLSVPAQGQLVLKPGSYHLMLFKPSQAWKAGDVIPLTLHTDQGDMQIEAVITSMKAGMMMH